jgi:hypothetical protein
MGRVIGSVGRGALEVGDQLRVAVSELRGAREEALAGFV